MVVVKTASSPPSRNQVDKAWSRALGFPGSQWQDTRNAMTHLRSPTSPDVTELTARIQDDYLPRIIELVYRVGTTGKPVELADVVSGAGCTWMKDDRWSEPRRVPWMHPDFDPAALLDLNL
jgi:hypothetical protein